MTRPPAKVHVDDEGYPDAPLDFVEAAVRATLAAQDREDVEVSVTLLPDEDMRELNHRFLGKDHTTDVLAFELSGGEGPTVGDVYLGYEQAVRQAREAGVPLEEELARLAVHGTLHVLGHAHPEGPERVHSPMFELQEEVLRRVLEGRRTG